MHVESGKPVIRSNHVCLIKYLIPGFRDSKSCSESYLKRDRLSSIFWNSICVFDHDIKTLESS